MKSKLFALFIVFSLIAAMTLFVEVASAEEPKPLIPDKALCEKMLSFGKQAYSRGRYLDAKRYFRNAVRADPGSAVAWRYYDQAVIFALAEKVEKDANLILPGASTRGEQQTPSDAPPVSPTPAPAEKAHKFKIMDDEGC